MAIAGLIIIALVAILLIVNVLSNDRTPQSTDRAANIADFIGPEDIYTMRVTGDIVAPENHNEIMIRVTQSERRIEITNGYDGRTTTMRAFPNSAASFDEFARALGGAGFMLDRRVVPDDPRGICPEGRRFNYNLKSGEREIVNTWSTSCSTSHGTFGGNSTLVQRLFEWQIPGYDDLVQGVKL